MPRARCLPSLAVLAVSIALLAATAGAATGAGPRTSTSLARADSLQAVLAWAPADTLLDSLAARARARGDRAAELAATVRQGIGRNEMSQPDRAAAMLEPLLAELAERRDTLLLCRTLIGLGRADDLRRRWPEALARYERAAALARPARLTSEEGRARLGVAQHALEGGKPAESVPDFLQALQLLASRQDRRPRLEARAGLARALQATGDIDGARREHAAVLKEAAALGDQNLLANTQFNLGSLEQTYGDPSLAPAHYEAALAIARQAGRGDLVLRIAHALSLLYVTAGQYDPADSLLSRTLPEAERSGDPTARALLRSQFGVLRREQGRLDEAVEYGRRSIALGDSIPRSVSRSITPPFLSSLMLAKRGEEALVVLRRQRDRLGSSPGGSTHALFVGEEADILLRLNRPREALNRLRPELAPSSGQDPLAENVLGFLVTAAHCWGVLGERDSALATYARAAAHWEEMRQAQSDPGWRERADNLALQFSAAYGAALLDPARGGSPASRAREAFETLQRFRARTLDERIGAAGQPRAQAAALPSLREFQERGLRPGEIFLDFHPGRDTTVVFAVERDSIWAWNVDWRGSLAKRFARLRALLADPADPTPELRAEAQARLGEILLGPAAGGISRARQAVVATGSLAQYPFGSLVAPGAQEPLAMQLPTVFVSSAALLLRARSGAQARAAPRGTVLAVAFTSDGVGNAIPDAAQEARWLATRFAGADSRVDERSTSMKALTASFEGYEALHFATHMRENSARPWQSAMYLGGTRDQPNWLTAAEVARLNAPVRLCVLAGCRSVGERGFTRETLSGLSNAWLAAGASTVVGMLWDADDESTRFLVHAFYENLARGQPAAQALRLAQLATRGQPSWSAPYYWAGAIALGDPETRLALKRR